MPCELRRSETALLTECAQGFTKCAVWSPLKGTDFRTLATSSAYSRDLDTASDLSLRLTREPAAYFYLQYKYLYLYKYSSSSRCLWNLRKSCNMRWIEAFQHPHAVKKQASDLLRE